MPLPSRMSSVSVSGVRCEVVVDDDAVGRIRATIQVRLCPVSVLFHRQVGDDARGGMVVIRHPRDLITPRAAAKAHPYRGPWCEEMHRRVSRVSRAIHQFMQRREVIENPERPPMRCHDHVRALDDQVMDRHDGQIAARPLPVAAIIEGDVQPRLRARVEQPPAMRVFTDHAREIARRDALGDARPRLRPNRSSYTGTGWYRRSCSASRRGRPCRPRAPTAR